MKTQEGNEIVRAAISTLTEVNADSSSELPSKIHLLRTGTFPTQKYGKLEITASDLNEMADNFKKGYGRPGQSGTGNLPVNFGHDKGGKAAAWITDLEADNDGNLWGTVDWTGSGKASVEAKDYQFISSEFTPRCLGGAWASAEGLVKGIKNVFTGAALTNIPMFNGNRAINASAESEVEGGEDKQLIYINADEKESSMNADAIRVLEAKDLSAEQKAFVEAHQSDFSKDELTKLGFVEADNTNNNEGKVVTIEAAATSEGQVTVEASEIKKVLDENAELKTKVEASETAKTELQKTVEAHAEQLKTLGRKDIEASVVEFGVKAGRIVADQKDKWVEMVEADASMLDTLKALPENKDVAASAIGKEGNNSDVTASETIDKRAKELMSKDKDLTIDRAYSQVIEADADLGARFETESQMINA